MRQAIREENPDYVIHLGDHTRDAQELKVEFPMLPIASVCGNCDYNDISSKSELIIRYDETVVWATHGHRYNVKAGLLRFFMAAKEKAVHIALFGHTHCAFCEKKDDVWLMNPGSCNISGNGNYGLIHIQGNDITCHLKVLER